LAFSAIQNNDKVGLLIFTDSVEVFIPPRKGRKQVLVILDELFRMKPRSRKTDIDAALTFVSHMRKRQAIVFLITDLIDSDYERGMKLLNARHDFVLMHISDPLDRELPVTGLLDIEDPETGSRITIDAGYREGQLRQAAELRQRLLRMKIDTVRLDTGRSFIGELNTFFRYRERKY